MLCTVPEIWSTPDNFFSFWTIFCHFITIFIASLMLTWELTSKLNSCIIPWCYILFLRYCVWQMQFLFFIVFFSFTPPSPLKNAWRYHHFTHVYQKLGSDDIRFLRYSAQQTDVQKKWQIEVGAPRNKLSVSCLSVFAYCWTSMDTKILSPNFWPWTMEGTVISANLDTL